MTPATTPTPDPGSPARLVARTAEDLLAVAPVVLGFTPQDSVVMLTVGAANAFHARIDLPPEDDLDEAVEALREPAHRHGVAGAVFVLYTDDARRAKRLSMSLVRAFERDGIQVVESLRADGTRWYPLLPGRPGVPAHGVPYDVSAHPFVAQAVLDGRVMLGSRTELAASLATDPGRSATLAAVRPVPRAGPPDPAALAAEGAWIRVTVREAASSGEPLPDADAARLLVDLVDLRLRDIGWAQVTRENARDHVAVWTDLVRRSPCDLLPAPAALLGFAAWLSGHGALAWCAVDVCQAADPDYGLADIVAQLLAHAVPPTDWDDWQDVLENPA
jgi:hypothetical protein